MSAESGKRHRYIAGEIIRPEPVVEKSFVESVAGFINEVSPHTYSNPSHLEGKETVQWVSFDSCDINDVSLFKDKLETNGNSPPLLLIVGYTVGVQGFVIPANGEAVEVFSWRQEVIQALKILPSPEKSLKHSDNFAASRPLIAKCDNSSPGPHFCSVSFLSMKTGEAVKTKKFKTSVHSIYANKCVVVITFPEKLAVFDAATLADFFTVTTCFPSPGPNLNPIALGDCWIAYADKRLYPQHHSCGGVTLEGGLSYKTTVICAAKSLTKGLKELGESVASNLIGPRAAGQTFPQTSSTQQNPGIVTILDCKSIEHGEVNLAGDISGVVAHFMAHSSSPIVSMKFDSTGLLLLTADKHGNFFHLFRIFSHPLSSNQTAVHHLYSLHRGETSAKVIDISFSLDSRWVAVSSHRGTTHVFPVTPYGGGISVRTHTSMCVVNRLSRFHRSAGLDDASSSGRNSPVLSSSPGASKTVHEISQNLAYPNPRYPPYPLPVIVKPLAQLRQPILQNIIDAISSGPSPSKSPPLAKGSRRSSYDDTIKVASVFGSPRGWIAGSPTVPKETKNRPVDSLFVMAHHGNLIEYYLEPKVSSSISQDKVTEDSPIELEVHAAAQWILLRECNSREVRFPLDCSSLLLSSLYYNNRHSRSPSHSSDEDSEERWMAQVEISTHAGPNRRLWMGPQFTFKSVNGSGPINNTVIEEPVVCSKVESSDSFCSEMGSGSKTSTKSELEASNTEYMPALQDDEDGSTENLDLESVMIQLRHDLADAMLDSPASGKCSGEAKEKLCGCNKDDDLDCDLLDVMDITCDPPGPSSKRNTPCIELAHNPCQEDIFSISSHVHEVTVTHIDLADVKSFNSNGSSAEDQKNMTSSAEELALVIGCVPKCNDSHPLQYNNNTTSECINEDKTNGNNGTSCKKYCSTSLTNIVSKDREVKTWSKIVASNIDKASKSCESFETESKSEVSSPKSQSQILQAVSSTTSEEDLCVVGKKRDKKKKKGKKVESQTARTSGCVPGNDYIQGFNLSTSDDYLESKENKTKVFMQSMHNESSLAKALEEASSDDNITQSHGSLKESLKAEMYPFRDSSSDDEEKCCIRRRVVHPAYLDKIYDKSETSGEDRGDSSADDIKSSDSYVGTSPTTTTPLDSKAKRRKKKKT